MSFISERSPGPSTRSSVGGIASPLARMSSRTSGTSRPGLLGDLAQRVVAAAAHEAVRADKDEGAVLVRDLQVLERRAVAAQPFEQPCAFRARLALEPVEEALAREVDALAHEATSVMRAAFASASRVFHNGAALGSCRL